MPRPRQPGSVFTKITLACGPNAPEPDYARTAPLSPTAASSRTAAGDDRRSQRTRPAGRRSPGLPASRQIIAVTAFDFHAARSLTSPLHRAAAAKTLIIPASASGSSAASAS